MTNELLQLMKANTTLVKASDLIDILELVYNENSSQGIESLLDQAIEEYDKANLVLNGLLVKGARS